MYYQYPPFNDDEKDERQFNFPGFLGGMIFGPPQQGPSYGPGPPGGNQYQGFPSGGSPGHQGPGAPSSGPSGGPPNTSPPAFTPKQSEFQTFAVDPGAIRNCLFRFTYVWLRRDAFWFFPVFIGRRSVAGYRWDRFRWVYFGIDLNQIQSFQCS